jgi:hypothetical protein
VVEQHRGGHERACEGSATGLVGARDERALERPIEAQEPPARSLRASCRRYRHGAQR